MEGYNVELVGVYERRGRRQTTALNAGYIAACLRDNYPYERRQFYLTKPKWEPVFEPDAAALSSYGDGAIKINQAIPGYITQDKMRDFTGI